MNIGVILIIMALNFQQLCEQFLPEIPFRILHSLAMVESSGIGWTEDNRIKLRFEVGGFLSQCPEANETFFTGTPSWTNHQYLSPEGLKWVHESQANEYESLRIAANICPTAAYLSISLGYFQLHSQHSKMLGFPFGSLFYSYYSESPEREFQVFSKFLEKNPILFEAMKNSDIDTIARFYNPGNPDWERRFREAYESFNNVGG